MACKTGRTLIEAADFTRVELSVLYAELIKQDRQQAAQTALFLLPAFNAAGSMGGQNKNLLKSGNKDLREYGKTLQRIVENGE